MILKELGKLALKLRKKGNQTPWWRKMGVTTV